MKRLVGMAPKEISSIFGFLNRMIEAIQMTNDERVQTKENYSRTCMLNTEYVGTMDFKLEDGDHYFLWRKGYLTAKAWLDKRSEKAKDKKKKVAKDLAKEMKKIAKEEGAQAEAAALAAKPKPTPANEQVAVPKAPDVSDADSALMDGAMVKDAMAVPHHALSGAHNEAELKAQIEKVLANSTLREGEKLDIIARKISKFA